METKKILVIDIPANATAAEAEQMLNAPYDAGYYVQTIACGFGLALRAIFRAHALVERNIRKIDPDDAAARAFIRDNANMTVPALVAALSETGIERKRTWVTNARLDSRGAGAKLQGGKSVAP